MHTHDHLRVPRPALSVLYCVAIFSPGTFLGLISSWPTCSPGMQKRDARPLMGFLPEFETTRGPTLLFSRLTDRSLSSSSWLIFRVIYCLMALSHAWAETGHNLKSSVYHLHRGSCVQSKCSAGERMNGPCTVRFAWLKCFMVFTYIIGRPTRIR